MNPYRAYQQQAYSAWLRIDMLLALYDGIIGKLESAQATLASNDAAGTSALLVKARMMLAGLVSSVDPGRGDMAGQFLRLYEFVNYCLDMADTNSLEAALKVLRTLREGLEAIRPEAAQLERSGAIPPAGSAPGVQLIV